MFSLSYMIWNEGQSPKGYSKWVVLRCLSYRIRVKSYIPIQTNLTEFVSRLLYSLAVILTHLNTPGIIGILTGTFTKGIIENHHSNSQYSTLQYLPPFRFKTFYMTLHGCVNYI